MKTPYYNRRSFLVAAGLGACALITALRGVVGAAMANQTLAPSETMRGGSNKYRPYASLGDNLGKGLEMFGIMGFSSDPSNLSNNGHDSSYGFGARVGYLGEIAPKIFLGLSYQSRIYMSE